ncbi:MAG: CPBP family intramembrane metalloprotease [Ruminococcaceae bacterium]|nr:CPBP family intramembrane metalloprotease [Oscillospiraceae bacterium]
MNEADEKNVQPNGLGTEEKISVARERLQLASVCLGVAFIFLASSILQGIVHSVILWNFPSIASADWYRWVIGSLPMYLFAMPLSLMIFRLGRVHPIARRERVSVPVFLALLAVCFGLTYAGQIFGDLINAIIGAVTGEVPENNLESMTMSAPLWANLLFVGILAPLMEELFYRKLVIDRLRRYGDLFAILASGVLFGLIHGNFHQFFYAAAIGCLFGYIYVRTGRIGYTVALHMGINLVGGVYTTEMLRLLDTELLASDPISALAASPVGAVMYLAYMGFLLLASLGAVVAAVLLVIFWRRPLEGASVRMHARDWLRAALLNPGIWLLCLVIFMLFAANI